MSAQIQYGPADLLTFSETQPPASTKVADAAESALQDESHFTMAVRFGRRKTDPVGHLTLTSLWLKFHGIADFSLAWAEVSCVEQAGPEIIVSTHEATRTLCLCCSADEDAARGAAVAAHLAGSATSDRCQTVYA